MQRVKKPGFKDRHETPLFALVFMMFSSQAVYSRPMISPLQNLTVDLTSRKLRIARFIVKKMKQNVTLSVDTDLLRGARVLAAEKGTSVSKFLASELERMVRDNQNRRRAKQQAMAVLEIGFHLGGGRIDRDALHER